MVLIVWVMYGVDSVRSLTYSCRSKRGIGDNQRVERDPNLPVYVPPGGPPRVAAPSREIYAVMGEEAIFRMMEDFYGELEQSSLRGMFPADMIMASRKSAAFFVGLLGGPPLYQQRYGSPMMRARHMPFAITEAGRVEWVACFERVLDRAAEAYGFPAQHLEGFRIFLREFSKWMVNTEG
jgi:hemoglobin